MSCITELHAYILYSPVVILNYFSVCLMILFLLFLPVTVPTLYFICRRGNDSQLAVQLFTAQSKSHVAETKDIVGGLIEWSDTVDPNFPKY